MRAVGLALWLCACGPKLPTVHTFASDGARREFAEPVGIEVVGPGQAADPAAMVVVRLGQLSHPGRAGWLGLDDLGGRLLPVPGAVDHQGDRSLKRYLRAFPELGVRGLGARVPWQSVDLVVRGVRWRLVLLDAVPGGPLALEQRFWLPKVVAGDSFDHLILLTGTPPDAPVTEELLGLVRAQSALTPLVLVLGGGADDNTIRFPAGSWGEALVGVGPAGWRLQLDGPSLALSAGPQTWRYQPDLGWRQD